MTKQEKGKPGREQPSKEQLMAYGELSFLFFRSKLLENATSKAVRIAVETATGTGQFAILRQGHVPRAAVTWALLSEDAETRFLKQEELNIADLTSGDRLWIMDLIAPYGKKTARAMFYWFRDQVGQDVAEFRTFRLDQRGRRRVLTAHRLENGRWGVEAREVDEVLQRMGEIEKLGQEGTG